SRTYIRRGSTATDAVFESRCRRKDASEIWCEVSLEGFEDADLGWCWIAVHRDITEAKQEQLLLDHERDRLQRALRSLPAIAYTTDRDLQPTVLFDNLLHPDQPDGRTGRYAELFGEELGAQVGDVNRRAQVTGLPARAELQIDLGWATRVVVSVDPVIM